MSQRDSSVGELVKNLAAALLFALFIFAVGLVRELEIENASFPQAVVTGAIAGGVILVLLASGVLILWRRERRSVSRD